jgi:hypothetical protein
MGSGDLSEQEAAAIGGPGGLMHDFDDTSADSSIPAGYIFFAQFIDHDVTLDTTSDLRGDPAELDVDTLPNIRSASLDLDCVYGFGPEASPHIYDAARSGHIAIHPNGHDVARAHGGQALIGDPRNDENIFVSQMQLMFQRFHNKMYEERLAPEGNCKHLDRFEEAQKQCRYHYQWLVLFDFLKRLCDPCVFRHAVPKILAGDGSQYPYFHKPDAHGKLRMPVEFSAAAYRVGHTMVRSRYAANAQHLDIELFDERFGTLGFSGIPEDLVMDWRYLLPVHRCIIPRMAKGIDPKLADEIQAMPLPVVNSRNPNDRALGFRNLMRGNVMRWEAGKLLPLLTISPTEGPPFGAAPGASVWVQAVVPSMSNSSSRPTTTTTATSSSGLKAWIPSNSLASMYGLTLEAGRTECAGRGGGHPRAGLRRDQHGHPGQAHHQAHPKGRRRGPGVHGGRAVQPVPARHGHGAGVPGRRCAGGHRRLPRQRLPRHAAGAAGGPSRGLDLGITLFAGESEGRFMDLLRAAKDKRMEPLYNYMDDLPGMEGQRMPYLPPEVARRYAPMPGTFDAGRGCPFLCSFCTIINVQGRKSRYRSPDDVERLLRANLAHGIRHYFITDDNFARNRNWEPIFDRIAAVRRNWA